LNRKYKNIYEGCFEERVVKKLPRVTEENIILGRKTAAYGIYN
jgi:hypothetical protein